MRGHAGRLTLLLAALLTVAGCDSGSSDDGPLPPDPSDWVCADAPLSPADLEEWCREHPDRGRPAGLPEPPPLDRLADKNAFDTDVLQPFLRQQTYVALGWHHDLNWRFAGPYVGTVGSGANYGTHPAIRLYYSPEVIDWLCNGRTGSIPGGAVIVKEMASILPCLDVTLDEDGCMVINRPPSPGSWTVMVRAGANSHDGWYWSSISAAPPDPPPYEWQKGNPPVFDRSAGTSEDFFAGSTDPPQVPNPLWYPTGYAYADAAKLPDVVPLFNGYGLECLNCHASAAVESTFTSLDNLITPGLRYKGFQFATGTCADTPQPSAVTNRAGEGGAALSLANAQNPFTPPLDAAPADWVSFYHQLEPVGFADVWEQRFPAETWDHVASPAGEPSQFLTSDQVCAVSRRRVQHRRADQHGVRAHDAGRRATHRESVAIR